MKGENIYLLLLYDISMILHSTYRFILNLKNLNNDMPYIYFKMETLSSVLNLITPGCYLASIDLKDAYYSVPIHTDYTKYLDFFWKGQLYKFLALPNGLCSGPRKFAKLMKPPIAILKMEGHIIAIYIDDLINVGHTFDECCKNFDACINLLQYLGFMIHPTKSVVEPKQTLAFLGFCINSVNMTVKLTTEKKNSLHETCNDVLLHKTQSIRRVAQVI